MVAIYKKKTMLLQDFRVVYRKKQAVTEWFTMEIPKEVKKALQCAGDTDFANCETFSRRNHLGSNYIPAVQDAEQAETMYFCAVVESPYASLVLVNMFSSYGIKLWFNEECLLIQSDFGRPMFNGKIRLKRGRNLFLIEVNTRVEVDFQLSLIPYSAKERKRPCSFLRLPLECNMPVFVHEQDYALGRRQTTILFVDGGVKEYLQKVDVVVTDSQKGNERILLTATMNKPLTITFPPTLPHIKCRHVRLEYTFSHINGKRTTKARLIVLADDPIEQETLKQELLNVAYVSEERTKDDLLGRLFYAGLVRHNPLGYYSACKNARDFLARVKNGRYSPDERYSEGNHVIWLHSELDGRYVRVRVRVPKNYAPCAKKYPAILYIALGEFSDYSTGAPVSELPEECLFFDISVRGMTCGSYVGEAAVMEMRNWILQQYAIDPTRMYLCGYSAGAYASWTVASTHPDLFAGIYIIGGLPDFRLTDNLSNLAIETLSSEEDFVLRGKNKKIRKAFSGNAHFKQYSVPMTLHRRMGQYHGHPDPVKKLLRHKGVSEPTEIHFRTDRNRHRQSHWITIHEVEKLGTIAEVKVKVLSEKEICVQATNVTGLTMRIPRAINREDFCVKINDTTFAYNQIQENYLHFKHTENGDWKQIKEEPVVALRRGTGLLDIYLGPMSIVVPENAEKEILNAAKAWSTPMLSTMNPQVFTSYPIHSICSLPESSLRHNLLCFDMAGTNSLCQQPSLPVRCDKEGYAYRGERVEGDYLVLQSVTNPYDERRSATIISTNNINFLKRNFFTRQLTLPSYIGGLHPYLNREILIWDGKRFFGTYVAGSPLEKI